jgi:hypothetical protein
LSSSNTLNIHFNVVAKAIREGRVIPFFGAGANLCGRTGAAWKPTERKYLPSGCELTRHLSDTYYYPTTKGETLELSRVSQYIDIMHGLRTLYEELHDLFDDNYPPTQVHHFFASLPSLLRQKKYPVPKATWRQRLVIMTTNYDDLMERAFEHAELKYHVLTYMADLVERGEDAGKFLHWTPERKPVLIDNAEKYFDLDNDQYPVLIKIHGNVDRLTVRETTDEFLKYDSYVITEDHYIEYLTSLDIMELLPKSIGAIISQSSFLFLGYALRDWNLRVILRRLWHARPLGFPSWAVIKGPEDFDETYWRKRDVTMIDMDLADYAEKLKAHI